MKTDLSSLRDHFKSGLLNDTIPFWTRNAIDSEFGGYIFSVDREGQVIDTDKSIWHQGRFSWLLSTLYSKVKSTISLKVEIDSQWIELAETGINFLMEHGFDTDGRMFFHVARDGTPIRKRRYFFSETFTTIAFAAYASATQDASMTRRARLLFSKALSYSNGSIPLPPKFTDNRSTLSLANPMILLATSQTMRDTIGYPGIDTLIDDLIELIENKFLKPDQEALMETVGINGEILDHFDGRLLNPGHAIEAAWFILHEAKHRSNDPRLIKIGVQILDWMWERGWDKTYGGLFYFRDLHNLPVQEYWHDMKFWWPHCEAIIATLLAWRLTKDVRYLNQFETVFEWTNQHFPDPEFGEWYGYLHRDGSLSSSLKGNMWKGGFHIPRMQLYCWQLLEAELEAENQFERSKNQSL